MLFHVSVINIPHAQAFIEACHFASAACLLFSHSICSHLLASVPACTTSPKALESTAAVFSPPKAFTCIPVNCVDLFPRFIIPLQGQISIFHLGVNLWPWQRMVFLSDGPNAVPPHDGSKTLRRNKNPSQHHSFIRIWQENRCILTVHV